MSSELQRHAEQEYQNGVRMNRWRRRWLEHGRIPEWPASHGAGRVFAEKAEGGLAMSAKPLTVIPLSKINPFEFASKDGEFLLCTTEVYRLFDLPSSTKKIWVAIYAKPVSHTLQVRQRPDCLWWVYGGARTLHSVTDRFLDRFAAIRTKLWLGGWYEEKQR